MPWLPLYADEDDFGAVRERLNRDEEVAYIVPAAPGRWRTVRDMPGFAVDRIGLWHVPSGPLPLLSEDPAGEPGAVADPWGGWSGPCDVAHPGCPYLGAGHPGVVWLNHRPCARQVPGGIGLSSFEWIGDRYSVTGGPASGETKRFWQALRKWVRSQAAKIPREGNLDGASVEIWAFPSALAAIKRGRGRDRNP